MRVAWLTTWYRACGIADYSHVLWPSVEAGLRQRGGQGFLVSLDSEDGKDRALAKVLGELDKATPDRCGWLAPMIDEAIAAAQLQIKVATSASQGAIS